MHVLNKYDTTKGTKTTAIPKSEIIFIIVISVGVVFAYIVLIRLKLNSNNSSLYKGPNIMRTKSTAM